MSDRQVPDSSRAREGQKNDVCTHYKTPSQQPVSAEVQASACSAGARVHSPLGESALARAWDASAAPVNVHGGSRELSRGAWCTPKWLADLIGPVDLDPCSNPRSHIQAAEHWMLELGQNGLLAKPSSVYRVFINPPYEH